MIKLSLPGFFCKLKYVDMFLNYYYQYPEFFYTDRMIDSFYDADRRLLWQGGRIPQVENDTSMFDVLDVFENYPVKLRHTFTNCLITDEYLTHDYFCNHFVKKFIRPQDEVIINSPLLIEHFKINYPDIPIIYSTTLNIKDTDKINDISKTNIYVLNYNYNNNQEYLNKLEHKNNIEILCAEPCQPNCPNRMEHYTHISKQVMWQEYKRYSCPMCQNGEEATFFEVMSLPHAITLKRLKELELQNFQYFKVSGRTLKVPQWLYTILYYVTLPEYLDMVYQDLLTKMW